MKCLLMFVLHAILADATIDFKSSQLIDESDIKNAGYGVQVSCPGKGCTVYTTKMSAASVAFFESEKQLVTLNAIYKKKDGYLEGYHMNPSNSYVVKKIGDVTETVTVYIVADIAGAGYVTDFDSNEFDLKPSGKAIVTVLSPSSGITFSNYKGSAAPKIYSTGFDMIASCTAMYTASSIDNAAKSKIGIVSALTTINFGSTDASNQYHVAKSVSRQNSATIGQSFVAMSSGYTGCTLTHNYNNVAFSTYDFKAGSESTKAEIKFGDLGVSQGRELTVKATGQNDKKISGYSEQSYSFTSSDLDVSISWANPDKTNDYFSAQVDFSNGVARAFGLSTLVAILARLV